MAGFPATRRRAAQILFVVVVFGQAYLILGRSGDVHHRYGFRPFSRSDTVAARIERVAADGTRKPIDDGTWAYEWNRLVGEPHLVNITGRRWASDGAPATLSLLDKALDWVIDHTPDDPGTRYLEATVTVTFNGRDPETVVLRSHDRVATQRRP